MAERDLDALVVRAPDNVLYLTNFWGMKGYDACVFPREGEPALICLEASAEDAARTAWTEDVRYVRGYDPDDARPPTMRTLDLALEASREYGRVGVERSMGTQASDRMVGEPTTFTAGWFEAFPDGHDATPVLTVARALKTEQEIERIRLANEICAAAMEHVRALLRPGMKESEAAAIWQGFVHGQGTGWEGKVELALPFSLVWSGKGIKTFTATGERPVAAERADAVRDLGLRRRLLGRPHEAPLPRRAARRLPGARSGAARDLRRGRSTTAAPGASLAELDVLVREGIAEAGYPGQPTHPICHGVGARAHEPPYAHRAADTKLAAGMVLAIEPGCYWEGGGGLRVEDNFLITRGGSREALAVPRRCRAGVTERVCIAGAGVIGSLFAGHLAQVADVSVLARREEHARALNDEGLRVSGRSDLHSRVTASTDLTALPEPESRPRLQQGHRRRRPRRPPGGPLAGRDDDDRPERSRRRRDRGRARRVADPLLGHVHERHAPRRHARRVHPRHGDLDRPVPGHQPRRRRAGGRADSLLGPEGRGVRRPPPRALVEADLQRDRQHRRRAHRPPPRPALRRASPSRATSATSSAR